MTDRNLLKTVDDLGRLFAAMACLALAASSHAAGPLFADPVILLSSATGSCTSGDFNNDGRSEFVVAAHALLLFQWNPQTSGMMQITIAPQRIAGKGNRYGGDMAAADIDGDGLLDIVVPNSNNKLGPGHIFWYKNPGTLTENWQQFTITTWPGAHGTGEKTADHYVRHMSEIEAADIDGDGDADVVTRDVQFGLFLLRNDGNNRWTRRHIPVNPREGLALGDIDRDGDLDIIINGIWLQTPGSPTAPADLAAAEFIQYPYDRNDANGDNQYPSANNSATQNAYAKKVKLGDMNSDGRIDIIVSNAEQLEPPAIPGGPKGIRIYLAPEKLSDPWREIILCEPTIALEERFSLHTLEIADLDRDGDLDILSAVSAVGTDRAPGCIFALLNDGAGERFTLQSVYAKHAYNNVLADADGDGDLDLFGGEDFTRGEVRYFQNLTPAPPLQPKANQP